VIRSDGTLIRDYFYVEDGAAAYMLLAERLAEDSSLRGVAFNFSNELQLTVSEIVERILATMGRKPEFDVRNEATNEIAHQYLSARRAREQLGWNPLFSLEDGLHRTVKWYEEFVRSEND
jgi:CDP-glucose 4,6-dehydratase